jgi:16S rRNA (guanine1207-N2)-methyltransferase
MDHYFSNNPNSENSQKDFSCIIGKDKYIFNTSNGVFSKDYLDYGTKVLLESLPVDKIKGKVLDLGCGYGCIGIYIAKKTNALVHMVDVNERAISLAKENSLKNNANTNVYYSNIYDGVVDNDFNFIITNPPIRAGKKVIYEMLFSAKNHLNKNGELWLVVRKKQGAKTIIRDLEKEYIVEVVNRDKGYYVIKANIID